MIEWACRTYGWRLDYVISEAPAIQLAMLYRCYAQGPGGVESGTLLEDELAVELWKPGGLMDQLAKQEQEQQEGQKK